MQSTITIVMKAMKTTNIKIYHWLIRVEVIKLIQYYKIIYLENCAGNCRYHCWYILLLNLSMKFIDMTCVNGNYRRTLIYFIN